MATSDSLFIGSTKYTFHSPKLLVSSNEAREQCQLQQMQLANIEGDNQFSRIAKHVEEYYNRGIYIIWHVGVGDKNGIIFLNMNRKFINTFVNKNIDLKVVERHRSLCTFF